MNIDKLSLNNRKTSDIILINWNIQNPGRIRSEKQFMWLQNFDSDILILTECKNLMGLNFLKENLIQQGYSVILNDSPSSNYTVVIASKIKYYPISLPLDVSFLPNRIVGVNVIINNEKLQIIGIYVPSRGSANRRNVDKRRFQNLVIDMLDKMKNNGQLSKIIITGDLNVIERDHIPFYSLFQEWEYEFYDKFSKLGLVDAFRYINNNKKDHSWFSSKKNGYRFDHLFVSTDLLDNIYECLYSHQPRLCGLSDHSPMITKFNFNNN